MDIHRKRNIEGFTLIELMVVLLIVALMAAVVGPSLLGRKDDAKQLAARKQIEIFASQLDLYYADNDHYPSTEQGLQALVVKPETEPIPKRWKGSYLNKKYVPKDPWGKAYEYISPGIHGKFDITSYGADGAEGGDKYDRDINSWESDDEASTQQ